MVLFRGGLIMAYRYTNTEKWGDSWFSNLSQIQMLLFIYLCDNCDIAGFIEINYKRWAVDLGTTADKIKAACEGLQRGLVYSNDGDCIFIKHFLKHQKNLPLNENNKAHLGIIRRFEVYANKFDIKDINEFIEGASKGLQSPTGIGNGNGIGKGRGNSDDKLVFDFSSFGNYTDMMIEWVDYKKDIKDSYKSQKSLAACFENLKKLSNDNVTTAKDIIMQSMANNWKGLFELKNKPKSALMGVGEFINTDGNRTYGTSGVIVPNDAPPRPSNQHIWSKNEAKWKIQ